MTSFFSSCFDTYATHHVIFTITISTPVPSQTKLYVNCWMADIENHMLNVAAVLYCYIVFPPNSMGELGRLLACTFAEC